MLNDEQKELLKLALWHYIDLGDRLAIRVMTGYQAASLAGKGKIMVGDDLLYYFKSMKGVFIGDDRYILTQKGRELLGLHDLTAVFEDADEEYRAELRLVLQEIDEPLRIYEKFLPPEPTVYGYKTYPKLR